MQLEEKQQYTKSKAITLENILFELIQDGCEVKKDFTKNDEYTQFQFCWKSDEAYLITLPKDFEKVQLQIRFFQIDEFSDARALVVSYVFDPLNSVTKERVSKQHTNEEPVYLPIAYADNDWLTAINPTGDFHDEPDAKEVFDLSVTKVLVDACTLHSAIKKCTAFTTLVNDVDNAKAKISFSTQFNESNGFWTQPLFAREFSSIDANTLDEMVNCMFNTRYKVTEQ